MSFNTLPKPAKNAIVIVGVVGGALILFEAYLKINAYEKLKKERATGRSVDKQLATLNKSGVTATLPDANIKMMADSLFSAMNGIGTSESAVYDILSRVQNEADMLSIIQAYGTRTISGGIHSFTGTLPETMIDQIPQSSMWRKSLNDINEMLAKKSITTRF